MSGALIKIALVGDYNPAVLAHRAITQCFSLAGQLGLGTETLGPELPASLKSTNGIWCVPASPYRSTEGALSAIQYARTRQVPFLGTCGGYQHAWLEFARNVLGCPKADHQELNGETSFPLLSRRACPLVEREQIVVVTDRGKFRRLYGAEQGLEGYHCSFGLNPEYEHLFKGTPLEIVARSEDGEARAFCLRGHPFYVGTQFQPERRALTGRLHPIVAGFFAACAQAPAAETASEPR